VDLNIETEGAPGAPAVVLLHGVTGSARTYAWLHPDDLGGRRVVRLDLRGHGASAHAPGTYRVGPYVDDVVAALRGLDGPPPVLVGHSLGGVIAWTIAQRHPDLIAAAFLEDPPLFFADPAEAPRNEALPKFQGLRDAVMAWREAGLDEEAVATQIAAGPGGDELADGAARSRAYALLSMDIGVLDAAIDNTTLEDADLVAPVGVPVFVLAGDETAGGAFQARHVERLKGSHPQVEVTPVPGASHFIHDEARSRDTYRRELAAFVDRFG
jgi:pimeloyl-ACP methyl ester carboxylesterase